MGKIWNLMKNHMNMILYLVFGILTTAVNCLIYFPLYNWGGLSAAESNAAAWIVSAAFAFLTNKPFVFRSYDWSVKIVVPELIKFLGTRIGSGLLETGMILIMVDLLHLDGNVMKLVTGALVVMINYVGSKLLVFKK